MMRKPKTTQPNARERLSKSFLDALEMDFREHGKNVIESMREKDPTRYAELAGKLVMTIEQPQGDGFEQCRNKEDVVRKLLQTVGCSDDLLTGDMIKRGVKAHDQLVAELEAIRDAALGPMQ